MTQASTPQALKARLLAMMVLRVVLAIAFLGITTWLQIRERSSALLNFYPLYAVVITVGLLTIIYAMALNRVRNLRLFTYAQVTVDIALVTVIVYVTGGTESYLHTLYALSVIGSSILLNKRGGFYAASVSSIAYGVLIDMDFYGMLPARHKVFYSHANQAWVDVFTTVSTNILAYFTVAYLTGYLAERTARVEKRLEEKEIDFEKLEKLNRHIVENITSGIMTLDEDSRITSFNREAENVTGYTLREVYYSNVHEIFPGMLMNETGANQSGVRVEKRFKRKNGDEIYLGFTISQGQGGDVASIIIFQDLTQLKAMEEQLRRDDRLKALGELSVGIAHEIRNPLASISGSIQVLKGDLKPGAEDEKLMEIVLRETERLNMLITDFLLFARPAPHKKSRVDLREIIVETIKVFSKSPEASNINIDFSINDPVFIQGDSRQLGQVFWNLFLNASHAMQGGGTLSVSSRLDLTEASFPETEGEAGHGAVPLVEIKVADTGSGIRPEDIGRIFDPFFSTKETGTGLGLAIVHRIVESHGGTIDVKSAYGRGAVFKLRFPLSSMQALKEFYHL